MSLKTKADQFSGPTEMKTQGIFGTSKSSKPSLRTIFAYSRVTIEEGGPYIGQVQEIAHEKAEKKCDDAVEGLRGFLSEKFGLDNVNENERRLDFPGGWIECKFDLTGGTPFEIFYAVDTKITLLPSEEYSILAGILKRNIDAIRGYYRLVFEASPAVAIQDVFEVSKAAGRHIEKVSRDKKTITIQVGDLWIDFETTKSAGDEEAYSSAAIYLPNQQPLPESLLSSISYIDVFDWVLGGISPNED